MKYISIIISFYFLCSCRHEVATATQSFVDSLPGQCPYLTRDAQGHAVLSWIRMTSDSTGLLCYAVSSNDSSFGAPVVIPGSGNIQPHGENLPKLLFKPSGEVIALWGAPSKDPRNKYAGLVFYAQSFDSGHSWTPPHPLVEDTSGYDQRYYDVSLLPNGEAGIIWLDNRKQSKMEGSGLHFAATQGRQGFQSDHMIAQPCCQCCRTNLLVDGKGGIHVLYRAIIQDSIRDMVHAVSLDGGKTFSAPERISEDNWVLRSCPHTGPSMTASSTGLHFAWFTGGAHSGCYYTRSTDNGHSFSLRDLVSRSGSHPQIASLPDSSLLIVWDETVATNSGPVTRIGLQRRNPEGKGHAARFITPDTSRATFPVLLPAAGHTLVAYSIKVNGQNHVAYQWVREF